jgi:hypothetical protein
MLFFEYVLYIDLIVNDLNNFFFQVTIGSDDDKNECLVTKVENQQILCDIEDMTTTYLINNEECGI